MFEQVHLLFLRLGVRVHTRVITDMQIGVAAFANDRRCHLFFDHGQPSENKMGLIDDMVRCGNGQEVYCTCDELLLGEGKDRHRVPCPKFHDCVYVARRNALLPAAIEHALEIVRSKPDDDSQSRAVRFSRALSIEMDRLAAPLLRNGS